MSFFFFNDTATTEIYTLSLHDALPISATPPKNGSWRDQPVHPQPSRQNPDQRGEDRAVGPVQRSEEHTSELQSRLHLVCRLLLEKKKTPQWTCHGARNMPDPPASTHRA